MELIIKNKNGVILDKRIFPIMEECVFFLEDLIAMLNGCTHIYMLKNYKDSKGATIELGLASSLNFTLIFE